MKSSLIFRTAMKFLFPIIILLSLHIFWRGHNQPGGGFIGGLVAVSACLLYALACGLDKARAILYFTPPTYMATGLLFAALSGFFGWATYATYFVGTWADFPIIGFLGSPVLFDLGVYLMVLGFALHVLYSLLEEAL